MRFGEAEGDAPGAFKPAEDEFLLLFLGAPLVEHRDEGEVADDRVFVLKVVVEAEALAREMLADHRHPEVAAVLPAIAFRRGEAPMPGRVGAAGGLLEQLLPLVPGQPARFEIRARIFAAVVEEADVVVLLFKRLDLGSDESVEFAQIGLQVGGKREVHGLFLSGPFFARMGKRGVFRHILYHSGENPASQLRQRAGSGDTCAAIEYGG